MISVICIAVAALAGVSQTTAELVSIHVIVAGGPPRARDVPSMPHTIAKREGGCLRISVNFLMPADILLGCNADNVLRALRNP